MEDKGNFEALTTKDEAQLLDDIGQAIASGPEFRAYKNEIGALGTRMSRPARMQAMAKRWLSNNRKSIHRAVCENELIRTALSANPGTTVEGFKLLVDAFTAANIYVPAGSLAMLVMRRGIESFCDPQAV